LGTRPADRNEGGGGTTEEMGEGERLIDPAKGKVQGTKGQKWGRPNSKAKNLSGTS